MTGETIIGSSNSFSGGEIIGRFIAYPRTGQIALIPDPDETGYDYFDTEPLVLTPDGGIVYMAYVYGGDVDDTYACIYDPVTQSWELGVANLVTLAFTAAGVSTEDYYQSNIIRQPTASGDKIFAWLLDNDTETILKAVSIDPATWQATLLCTVNMEALQAGQTFPENFRFIGGDFIVTATGYDEGSFGNATAKVYSIADGSLQWTGPAGRTPAGIGADGSTLVLSALEYLATDGLVNSFIVVSTADWSSSVTAMPGDIQFSNNNFSVSYDGTKLYGSTSYNYDGTVVLDLDGNKLYAFVKPEWGSNDAAQLFLHDGGELGIRYQGVYFYEAYSINTGTGGIVYDAGSEWDGLSWYLSGPTIVPETPKFWTGLQNAIELVDYEVPGPVLPEIGEYWTGEGGYYAGIWTHPSGAEYHLIVAPVEFDVAAANWTETTGEVPGARSNVNGPENTAALLALSKQAWAAEFCAGTSIDGHSDFYLMSCGTYDWDVDGGRDASEALFIVNALGAGSSSPNFGSSGPQAFQADFYWSSTEHSYSSGFYGGTDAVVIRMSDGATNQGWMSGDFYRVRPIRRIPV